MKYVAIIFLLIAGLLFANWLGYKQGLRTPREYGDWPRWLWCPEYQSWYYYASLLLIAAMAAIFSSVL